MNVGGRCQDHTDRTYEQASTCRECRRQIPRSHRQDVSLWYSHSVLHSPLKHRPLSEHPMHCQ